MQQPSNNSNTNSVKKLKGKSAIHAAHVGISKDDEKRINRQILEIYKGINLDEAEDIHCNYHAERIISVLIELAAKHGMTKSVFDERIKQLNINELAYQVATGQLLEMAAVDLLYDKIRNFEGQNSKKDRYINFYG